MDEPITTPEAAKREATPNRGTLQSYIQNYSKEAIDAIVDILRTTRNEALRMGAAKVIIDKSIPDIKAVELTGEHGEPIKLNIISGTDYLSAFGIVSATPAAGTLHRSTFAQGTGLASASTQDDNSNQSDSQVESA